MSEEKRQCVAVLRLRGSVGIDKELEYVFKLMHLTRKNHLVLIENTPSNMGSIYKIKDYATWGEVNTNTISLLLENRGKLQGGKKLTEDYVKEELGYTSIKELAAAINNMKIKVNELNKVKPIFRLHPPKKGFDGSPKKHYPKGELGYRGESISELITRMV
ncbi:MAG: 50S ribosomal protein L30 [Candidatus Bathyarchaeota archaeon]